MLCGWEDNHGPGEGNAAYRQVYDYDTCVLIALRLTAPTLVASWDWFTRILPLSLVISSRENKWYVHLYQLMS